MRGILSPLPHYTERGQSSSPASNVWLGSSKVKLASEKYSSNNKGATKFLKKFVLIDYMGSKASKNFNMKDAMRGMLPEISQDSSLKFVTP